MNNNEQQQPKITDEEVWLRAYCASIANPNESVTPHIWPKDADKCLADFKFKFRQNERT